jgi:hypothetical protein
MRIQNSLRYQEGTFVPSLTFGGASVGMTYAARQGFYARVGNLVTASIYVVLSAKGTSNGDAAISLPFAGLVALSAGAVNMFVGNVTYSGMVVGWSDSSGVVNIQQVTEAGVRSQLSDANFADNSNIGIQITYRT